jgi:hypothetical protein
VDGVFSDLAGLRIPQEGVPAVKHAPRPAKSYEWVDGKFLRGPISLDWLGRARELPGGNVMGVALAIWHAAGLRNRKSELKLTSVALKLLRVNNPAAKSRALAALERAGLIRVERQRGKNPLVTILNAGTET